MLPVPPPPPIVILELTPAPSWRQSLEVMPLHPQHTVPFLHQFRNSCQRPPLSAFLATRAFPSAVRGPVDFAQGCHCRISAACRARRSSVQPLTMFHLPGKFHGRVLDRHQDFQDRSAISALIPHNARHAACDWVAGMQASQFGAYLRGMNHLCKGDGYGAEAS